MEPYNKTLKYKLRRRARKLVSIDYYLSHFLDYAEADKLLQLDILAGENTVKYLTSSSKSLIRWGDGEANMIMKGDLNFQKYHPDLREEMLTILNDYSNDASYLIGIPYQFICISKKDYFQKDKRLQHLWKSSRYIFNKYLKKECTYGDAFIFRNESPVTKETLENLWVNKNVLIISSDINNKIQFVNAHENVIGEVQHLLVPAKHAFKSIDKTFKDSTKLLNRLNKTNKACAVISAGPAGKVLAYRLIKEGYQVFDTGHYFKRKI